MVADAHTEVADSSDYTSVLLAGYLSAPLLGAGVALTVSGFDTGDVSLVAIGAGAASALFVPSTIHWLSGERRLAARSFIAWPIAIFAGGLCVGLVTLAAVAVLDPFGGSHDEGGWGSLRIVLVGAGIGAGMAAIAWPIFDILDTRARRREQRDHQIPRLSFSLAPLVRGGVLGVVRGTL